MFRLTPLCTISFRIDHVRLGSIGSSRVLNDPALKDAIKEICLFKEKIEALRRNYRHAYVGFVGRSGRPHVTEVDLESKVTIYDLTVHAEYEIQDSLQSQLILRDVFTIPSKSFGSGAVRSTSEETPTVANWNLG